MMKTSMHQEEFQSSRFPVKLFPLVLGVLRHIRLWPMETHLGQNLQYLISPSLITYNFPPIMDKSWNMFLL